MSIAEDEAEKAYPTRYWGETHVKKQFYCDTDDLQEAYLRGRNAPPPTPRSKPWRNDSSGTAAKGITTNMRQRTRKKHGIAKAASPDGRKTISNKPRNYSHWRGRR